MIGWEGQYQFPKGIIYTDPTSRDIHVNTRCVLLFSTSLQPESTFVSKQQPPIHMAGHRIKIAARLRPRLEYEIDDQGIQITHDQDGEGPSWICVPNPRDVTQIFRFPCVQFVSFLSGMAH